MKVLLLTHNFLPGHRAGTELYTLRLGKELARRGHEVEVFTTEKDISRPHLSMTTREVEGLRVHELVNDLYYRDFRETWEHVGVEARFAEVVDRLRPDVLHVHHLLYLSVGCVELAARRGIGVLFTLHDYWLQCPRFGQRVHVDGTICHEIDFARCGGCLTRFKYKQTDLERRVGKGIARVRSLTGVNLGPLARRAARRLLGEELPPAPHERRALEEAERRVREREHAALGSAPSVPPPTSAAEREADAASTPGGAAREASPPAAHPALDDAALLMARAARQRDHELRARLRAVVHRFLAPSAFLRERFLEWGLAPDEILLLRTGLDLEPAPERPSIAARLAARAAANPGHAGRLRVSFLGSLVPVKGPHVLLEAWGFLPSELRAKAELVLHGPVLHNPAYVERVQAIAARVGARVAGALAPDEVPAELARTDLLVVPSLWYENAPLVILEALAARTPLAVSDLGGMAELVAEGRTGFVFAAGDRDDLARVLALVLREPERLDALCTGDLPLPRFTENVDVVERVYAAAVADRRGRIAREGSQA